MSRKALWPNEATVRVSHWATGAKYRIGHVLFMEGNREVGKWETGEAYWNSAFRNPHSAISRSLGWRGIRRRVGGVGRRRQGPRGVAGFRRSTPRATARHVQVVVRRDLRIDTRARRCSDARLEPATDPTDGPRVQPGGGRAASCCRGSCEYPARNTRD